jgi:hypothetical protein
MKKLLVLLVAGAFVLGLTLPAMSAEKEAVDWGFYGNARFQTFSDSVEPKGGDKDTDLIWRLEGNSRIGAKVKAGNIGGHFEYDSTPGLRLLYGTWNFGAGSLLVGQSYTPLDYFASLQVKNGDTGLIGFGNPYTGRLANIALNMAGLELALVEPNANNINATIFDDTDTSLPKLEAAYKINLGPAHIKLLGAYQTYDLVAGNQEKSLDAYVYGFGFTAPFGPAYLKGSLLMGNNAGNAGLAGGGSATATSATQIVDNDTTAYTLVAGFKASDALSFEVGYGHIEDEDDISNAATSEADSYYAQATINIAKGFFIVPEIGRFESKTETETTYFGAKWQINF